MNKVVIIGAGGGLARYVIEALKPLPGIALTLFARSKKRVLPQLAEGCAFIEGDAMQYEDILKAVDGQDIVYVNLAGNLEIMALNIVRAMQEKGVKRMIAISSIGIYDMPLKPVLMPYRKLADVIEASGLEYTILRPDWFTQANEIDYVLTQKGEPEIGTAISKKSIATFVAAVVASPELHVNENLGISKPD